MMQAFLDLVATVCGLLTYAVIIRAVMSWFQPNPSNPIVRLLIRITDPILLPIQRILPNFGGLDISPIVALIILQAIPALVFKLLAG